jgi:hypothetical protein
MSSENLYKKLFELTGYMLTSARGLIDEPGLYGPFRLIDGVSRLCEILKDEKSSYSDFFCSLKEKIDNGKYSVMSNEESFIKLLDQLVLEYTRRLKKG